MTNLQRNSLEERDVEKAITALKRGSYLLKYGRRGKPKFCPFRLSNDETTIIWYAGKEEKQLQLRHVSRIIPGQRTAIFQRYPRPEKDYQSFSLIYSNRSLDLICKDKDEAEIWFGALRALISRGNCQNWRNDTRRDSVSSDNSSALTHRYYQSFVSSSSSDIVYEDPRNPQKILFSFENPPQKRLGRAFSDCLVYNAAGQCSPLEDFVAKSISSQSSGGFYDPNDQSSADTFRVSLSSVISSSSHESPLEDFNSLGDVFIWGQGIGDGLVGGGAHSIGETSAAAGMDALLPKALESTLVLDAKSIACGSKHAALVTKNGEVFSWGEGSGGKLGHGIESDFCNPKLINALSGFCIESVACGENHTLAITLSGDLYSWGDGIHNLGLLGHGTEFSHWIPKKVRGSLEGVHVTFISCGPWHSAVVTSAGQLFTFGDGMFGALGHGDRISTSIPREVETLKGLRVVRVSCGVWHTAAVVGFTTEPPSSSSSLTGKLFTWGDGDKGQLGHGDKEPRLVPSCVAVLNDTNFRQVVCGHSITVALTTFGQVYTMGSPDYGQLGSPGSAGKLPVCVEGKIKNNYIEEIACGSHHIAVLSSKSEVYTWGKGANGQLGHGDIGDRNIPTPVEALRDKRARSIVCGSNFTAIICVHKWVSTDDYSICSGCHTPFSFIRKRHNCYNCGLVFCNACSSKKSLKASLAPDMHKTYRVCEDCFAKLNKTMETRFSYRPPTVTSANAPHSSGEVKEPETSDAKARRLLSRLASVDSFKSRNSKNRKLNSNNGHATSIRHQSFQSDGFSTPNSSNSIFDYLEKISASVPGSTMHSRAVSPVSVKSSPAHSVSFSWDSVPLGYPEVTLDDSKRANDNLTKEVSILREQVDLLAQKSQLLEAQLMRMSGELREATESTRYEREKNIAAKEVIKSLTIQLKDMAGRVPQESSLCRISDSFAENTSSTLKQLTS